MPMCGDRKFQAEGTVRAKALRKEHAHCVFKKQHYHMKCSHDQFIEEETGAKKCRGSCRGIPVEMSGQATADSGKRFAKALPNPARQAWQEPALVPTQLPSPVTQNHSAARAVAKRTRTPTPALAQRHSIFPTGSRQLGSPWWKAAPACEEEEVRPLSPRVFPQAHPHLTPAPPTSSGEAANAQWQVLPPTPSKAPH